MTFAPQRDTVPADRPFRVRVLHCSMWEHGPIFTDCRTWAEDRGLGLAVGADLVTGGLAFFLADGSEGVFDFWAKVWSADKPTLLREMAFASVRPV
jgi:hypothetical protein